MSNPDWAKENDMVAAAKAERVSNRLTKLESQQGDTDRWRLGLDKRLEGIEKSLHHIETSMAAQAAVGLEAKIGANDGRLTKLKEQMDQAYGAMKVILVAWPVIASLIVAGLAHAFFK